MARSWAWPTCHPSGGCRVADTHYALAWPTRSPLPGLPLATREEVARRKRYAPGLWSQRIGPGEVPAMPPTWRKNAFSTCGWCPYACCEKCPPNDEWTEFHAQEVEANTARRRTPWQRLTGRVPQESTNA